MSGFKNAPTITEFRRGMRIQLDGAADWHTVVHVHAHGAVMDNWSCVGSNHIPCCHLDLTSVWEGQVRTSNKNDRVEVFALSNDFSLVSYLLEKDDNTERVRAWATQEFSDSWPTIVWPEPAKTLEDIFTEWRSKYGTDAWFTSKEKFAASLADFARDNGVTLKGQDDG